MRKVIVFPDEQGSVLACFTAGELPLDEVARKDVPAGVPYLIMDESELPPMELQHAWEADFSNPHGYGIGQDAWFVEQAARTLAEKEAEAQE